MVPVLDVLRDDDPQRGEEYLLGHLLLLLELKVMGKSTTNLRPTGSQLSHWWHLYRLGLRNLVLDDYGLLGQAGRMRVGGKSRRSADIAAVSAAEPTAAIPAAAGAVLQGPVRRPSRRAGPARRTRLSRAGRAVRPY